MQTQTLNASQKTKKTLIGDIPIDWEITKLGEYVDEVSQRNNKENIPVLSVTNNQGFVISEEFFDRKVYSKDLSNYKVIRKGQFAYNPSRVNVGSISRLQEFEHGLLSPMYVVFETKNGLDGEYLDYWIQSQRFRNLVKANTQGTVRDSLNFSALANFPFALPPLPEQRKTSNILSSVDGLIEKTQAVIDQTQTLKKGLMQELFTHGIPGRHKKFKKTDIGEIPEEWKVVKLSQIVDINPEQLGSNTNSELVIKYLDISGIHETGLMGEVEEYIFKQSPSRARRKVRSGDIIISTVRPYLRAFAFLRDIDDNLIVSTGFAVLRTRNHLDAEFIYQHILHERFVNFLLPRMTGSNYPAVRADDILDYKIGYPSSTDERQAIVSLLCNIDLSVRKQKELLKEIQILKSALMQVLLTGEVRVKI